MNPLAQLAGLLAQGNLESTGALSASADAAVIGSLDATIARLQARIRSGTATVIPEDAQLLAIERFWKTQSLSSVRDGRLVSYGITLPVTVGGATLLDDSSRMLSLLKAIDSWRVEPRRFRRCYQGLVRSWFAFDGKAADGMPAARENWERLRLWLLDRLPSISAPGGNPEWVETLLQSRHLFGAAPGEPYAAAMLRGDSSAFERTCVLLGIAPSSWFVRDVMFTQLREAARLGDQRFATVLARLLDLLGRHPSVRDQGLAMLLDRYAASSAPQPHVGLLHAAVLCWGSPLAEDTGSAGWSRVGDAARAMVSHWLRAELLAVFFGAFCLASPDDPQDAARRSAFWKRYLPAIDRLDIVLPDALAANLGKPPADQPLIRRKLEGSVRRMSDARDPAATALVMRLGDAVLVEFGNSGHGVYGFAAGAALPFGMREPLSTSDPAPNTLRHPSRTLHMQHRDGLQGWSHWEAMFDALLLRQYGLEPGKRRVAQARAHVDLAVPAQSVPDIDLHLTAERSIDPDGSAPAGLSAHWQTAEAAAVEFGRAELAIFARVHSLQIEDNSRSGGEVRVLAGDGDEGVAWVLQRWGFVFQGIEGWVRESGYR